MKPNNTYFARTPFQTIDQNDATIAFEAGKWLIAQSFDTLVDPNTGEVFRLPLHIARNPEWYFHRVGDMGLHVVGPKVSQAEFTRELVRGNEGLDTDCLWKLGNLEGWLACNTAPTYGGFTSCLSNHEFLEPHLNGEPVKRTKKERGHLVGYTWHSKRSTKKNRDGLFAA